MAGSRIKVLSYNIHKGFGVGNVKFLLDEIRSAIRMVDPDIVNLQEVCGRREANGFEKKFEMPEEPQFEFLADSIWQHHAYGKNAIYQRGDHGNAVLSKAPIETWENIDISVLGFSQRGILHGVVNLARSGGLPPRKLHVLNVHLGLFEAERRSQIEALCDRIHRVVPDSDPLILAGDFNDWRMTADRVLLERLNLQEGYKAFHGNLARTFPVWLPIFRLDRIYFRGLQICYAESLTGAPWNRLSDHAPLYTEYESI
jgi:endonuclease/exonuclease/phosphatase family metal-dependent hydrolase